MHELTILSSALEFRRIPLDEPAQAEAESWRPALELDGVVDADAVCGGTPAVVAVVREAVSAIPRHADGTFCWLLRGDCLCYRLGRARARSFAEGGKD